MHVDTGHNFPEVIEFRDRRVAELRETLVVASVQESIDRGRVVEETGPRASRNQLQTTTLLDAIEEHRFDAAIGGARRDEERSRAKERIFSFRDPRSTSTTCAAPNWLRSRATALSTFCATTTLSPTTSHSERHTSHAPHDALPIVCPK